MLKQNNFYKYYFLYFNRKFTNIMLSFAKANKGITVLIWALFCIILIIISVNDFLFFRIENEYILSLIALYGIAYLLKISGHNLAESAIIATVTFVLSVILNHFNLIGGGDVKLLFPLVLFADCNIVTFVIGMSISGLILSVIYFFIGRNILFLRKKIISNIDALYKNCNNSVLLNITLLSFHRIDPEEVELSQRVFNSMRQEIPYGIALSCGGLCVMIENLAAR